MLIDIEAVDVKDLLEIRLNEQKINAAESNLSDADENVADSFHGWSKLSTSFAVAAREGKLDSFGVVRFLLQVVFVFHLAGALKENMLSVNSNNGEN